jgi:hypothetical protein
MALLPRIHESHVQRNFKFLGNHLTFLHGALQRMLVLPCEIHNLLNLGMSDIPGINTTYPNTFSMHFEHDLCRPFLVDAEKLFQDQHHEFHRGVVVIQQQHLVQGRRLYFGRTRFQKGTAFFLGCHSPNKPELVVLF